MTKSVSLHSSQVFGPHHQKRTLQPFADRTVLFTQHIFSPCHCPQIPSPPVCIATRPPCLQASLFISVIHGAVSDAHLNPLSVIAEAAAIHNI